MSHNPPSTTIFISPESQNFESKKDGPLAQACLSISNICYEVKVKDQPKEKRLRNIIPYGASFKRKTILTNISFIAKPGNVLALMGASGSGKSSLLDLLADSHRSYSDGCTGEILLNGYPLKKYGDLGKRIVSYVMQEDDFLETLTVLETLTFAAEMRLPRNMDRSEKINKVYSVMEDLNLTHVKDTRIGGLYLRGISGGEKRRVTIAIELLSSPSILLLDEPTSGLSSTDALNVVKSIKDLASKGLTVIMAVHQPRSDIVELFDDLLLLSKGHIVYYGPARQTRCYFKDLGYECPVDWNVADYTMDLVTDNEGALDGIENVENKHNFARSYTEYLENNGDAYLNQSIRESSSPFSKFEGEAVYKKLKEEYKTQYAATTFVQTKLLSKRNVVHLSRHPIYLANLAIHIVFAFIVGTIVPNARKQPSLGNININVSVVLFFAAAFIGTLNFTALPPSILERKLFWRERASGMYRTSAYFLSRSLIDIVSSMSISVIFMTVVYYLNGFQGSLLNHCIYITLISVTSMAQVTAIASSVRSIDIGFLINGFVLITNMLFAGFLVVRDKMPSGWAWIYWINYYQWTFSGMVRNEFSDAGKRDGTIGFYGVNLECFEEWRIICVMLGFYLILKTYTLLSLIYRKFK